MIQVHIAKRVGKVNENKLSVFKGLLLKMIKNILKLIIKYVLNIMKKVEFELIRNDGVYVKVTDEQKAIIKKLARCQKKSTSEFIKWVIFHKYVDDFIK